MQFHEATIKRDGISRIVLKTLTPDARFLSISDTRYFAKISAILTWIYIEGFIPALSRQVTFDFSFTNGRKGLAIFLTKSRVTVAAFLLFGINGVRPGKGSGFTDLPHARWKYIVAAGATPKYKHE